MKAWMKKVDYKQEFKLLYRPSARSVEVVEVPPLHYLMISGEGDPNTSRSFQDGVETLFSLSYALKFMAKRGESGVDYGVLPLEGLWWADDMASFNVANKVGWKWTLMIMQPDCIGTDMVRESMEQVRLKKNPVSLPLVSFEPFEEGTVAQILHIGPFSEEGPTVEKVHSFIAERGSQRRGKHHEIYLSDIRRAAPEKWKTIIRQPMS
jgi:hypothetical protein